MSTAFGATVKIALYSGAQCTVQQELQNDDVQYTTHMSSVRVTCSVSSVLCTQCTLPKIERAEGRTTRGRLYFIRNF